MSAVGGSLESMSIDGRNFAAAADADVTIKLGGYENEAQANGNGTARMVKTAVPWSIDGAQLEIDDARGDQEFLQDIADKNTFVPITITLASGVTYSGTGTITGELGKSSQSATAGVSFMGQGKLEKQ